MALSRINSSMIGAGDVSNTEHAYLNSVSSNVQTQIDGVGGKVLQVVSTTKTDTFSATNGTTWSDVTGLSAAITPSATSSKILVQWNVWLGTSTAENNCYIRVLRDSTAISIGDTAGSRNRTSGGGMTYYTYQWILASGNYLDSPSTTSATTFKIQIASQGSITKYVNRSGSNSNVNYTVGRTASTITVMEIGA